MSALARLSDPAVRRSIEDEIERLISLLDFVDPDPDLEPFLAGAATDRELDTSDFEHSLGWSELSSQGRDHWLHGGCRYIAGIDGDN